MKKTIVILFVSLFLSISSSCQIPMGKDINVGIIEVKLFMKNSGYTFLKESQGYSKNIITGKYDIPEDYNIFYKEEIWISLSKNEFDNIDLIVITCADQSSEKILLEKLGWSKWEYLYSKSSWGGAQRLNYYKIDNFYSILSSDNSTINFKRSIPPPDK